MTNVKHSKLSTCYHSWFGPVLAFIVGSVAPVSAAIIGTNPPALPLTADRVATLPKAGQREWKDYLKRSDQQRREDQTFLQKEMRRNGVKQLIIPPEGRGRRWLPLDRPAAWYGGSEARHIADVILSFQTPAGGWSKNLVMTNAPRARGMHFAADNTSRFPTVADFDSPSSTNLNWNYVGTFDNDATIMQIRFLAKVIAAVPKRDSKAYRASALRGLDYVFASQYPHGGWPQVWPLQGGYHDGCTYNDNATINILTLLREVAQGTNEFAFTPARTRRTAEDRFKRGTDFVLATQIVVDGRLTIWAQQYDPLTLKPTSARNYEMPSLAAGESAGVMLFLMQLPNPNARTVAAVQAAAAWF